MSTIEKLPSSGSPFATIRTEDSADGAAHWLFMHADAATGIRPCCRKDMLDEMWSYMAAITRSPAERHNGHCGISCWPPMPSPTTWAATWTCSPA
jgi:DSF synthase